MKQNKTIEEYRRKLLVALKVITLLPGNQNVGVQTGIRLAAYEIHTLERGEK